MKKKRSSDGEHTDQKPETTCEPARRSSRRAAREAAQKILNEANGFEPLPTPDQTEQKTKRLSEADIELELECEDESLSEVQERYQQQAMDYYHVTMRNLRQLAACPNVRLIEERPGDNKKKPLHKPHKTGKGRGAPMKTKSMPQPLVPTVVCLPVPNTVRMPQPLVPNVVCVPVPNSVCMPQPLVPNVVFKNVKVDQTPNGGIPIIYV